MKENLTESGVMLSTSCHFRTRPLPSIYRCAQAPITDVILVLVLDGISFFPGFIAPKREIEGVDEKHPIDHRLDRGFIGVDGQLGMKRLFGPAEEAKIAF